MDVGRVGSLFIRAVESFLEGNAIRLTLTFKAPIDRGRMAAGFKQLVASHESLRLRFETNGFASIGETDVQAALEAESANFETPGDAEHVYAEYHPTNDGLPIRLRLIDDYRMVLSLNHVFGNGRSALYYLEELLRLYANEKGAVTQVEPAAATRVVSGIASASAYLASFVCRAGLRPARTTVDLSSGKKPAGVQTGYAIWRYPLTPEETQSALKRSAEVGLSLTEHLSAAMARVLFDAQPDRSRVCISIPTDLSKLMSPAAHEMPGNFTGSLIVQVRRGDALDRQMQRAFAWAKREVHYWTPWLLGRVARSEAKLSARFRHQAHRPIPERAPFENFSCAVSSVGVVQGPLARKYLAAISATTRTQTIFLCAMTLNGSMSIEVSVSNDLFNWVEVAGLTDRAVALLTGMRVEDAGRKRANVCRGKSKLMEFGERRYEKIPSVVEGCF